MPQYLDQYFLVENRDSTFVLDFLNKYMPEHHESTDSYPVPQYEENTTINFKTVIDLLEYLEQNTKVDYSVYWHNQNQNSVIQHLMAFYTDDGKLILGVSINGNYDLRHESLLIYNELKVFLSSQTSCITVEEPPPASAKDFFEFARHRYPNR